MTAQPRTTPAAVERAASVYADRTAIVDGDVRPTFAQLRDHVREFAAALVAHGVGPGARVAIWSPNTHHWIVAALGIQWAGGVVVPVNTRYTGAEAHDILDRIRAEALVVAEEGLHGGAHAEAVRRVLTWHGLLADLGAWRAADRRAAARGAAAGRDGPEDGQGDRPQDRRTWQDLDATVRQRLKDLGYTE